MADDKTIEQQRKEFAKEIRDVNSELKPGFQKIINSLEEASPQIAKITADFRASSKDTFKGALATKKLKGLSGIVDKYMSGVELSAKEAEMMQKNFATEVDGVKTGFNFTGMRIAQQSFNKTQETVNKIEKNKQAAYLKETKESRETFRAAEKAYESGKINAIEFNEARAKFEEENAASQKIVNDKYDKGLEFEKEKLEERKTKLDGFTEDYKTQLEKTTDFKGMTKFSEGLDELIGIDLLGMADTFTKKVNAFGDVMRGIGEFMGSPVKKFKEKFGPALDGITSVFKRGEESADKSKKKSKGKGFL